MPTVAIIAPCAYAPNPEFVPRAISRLQQRGWTVKNLVSPDTRYLRFSADDASRLAQLYRATEDPDVDLVMALRGGYGMSRLVDQIDFPRLAASGKLFMGFSDFTPLHCGLLAKAGRISFAGPMLYDDLGSELEQDFTFDQFTRCLSQDRYSVSVTEAGNPEVHVRGTFWGGNLTMLTHLTGTPYLPQVPNGILFERMIMQLHLAGVLAQQQALVLGHFTNYRPTEYDNGYDFNGMLAFIRSKIGIPVITGLPFGHCPNKVTLPFGAVAELNADSNGFQLEFSDYPNLAHPHQSAKQQ